MSSLYMGGTPETISKYVLFSGDPWRVNVLKQYLEEPQQVAFYAGVQHLYRPV